MLAYFPVHPSAVRSIYFSSHLFRFDAMFYSYCSFSVPLPLDLSLLYCFVCLFSTLARWLYGVGSGMAQTMITCGTVCFKSNVICSHYVAVSFMSFLQMQTKQYCTDSTTKTHIAQLFISDHNDSSTNVILFTCCACQFLRISIQ